MGVYGQFSWSTSTAWDPNAWDAGRDRDFHDFWTCAMVDRSLVWLGFFVDITYGLAHDEQWLNEVPEECTIDGEEVAVGAGYVYKRGTPLGDMAAYPIDFLRCEAWDPEVPPNDDGGCEDYLPDDWQ